MSEVRDNSILSDTRGAIGYNPDDIDPEFDRQIKSHINTSIARLAQLGLGKLGDFNIEDGSESWNDYLGDEYRYLYAFAKDFIEITVKLKFDAPTSGALKASLEEQLKTAEFNVMTAIEEHNIDADKEAKNE